VGLLAILRYPIKAMLGERIAAAAIGPGGVEGDREWVVVDRDSGERIANKRGPTDPCLRACRAELLDERDEHPPLRITLPDASTRVGAEIEAAVSDLLERRVRLERSDAPADGRFGTTGAYHDVAPIHFVTTGTLAHLRAVAPGSDTTASTSDRSGGRAARAHTPRSRRPGACAPGSASRSGTGP